MGKRSRRHELSDPSPVQLWTGGSLQVLFDRIDNEVVLADVRGETLLMIATDAFGSELQPPITQQLLDLAYALTQCAVQLATDDEK